MVSMSFKNLPSIVIILGFHMAICQKESRNLQKQKTMRYFFISV